MQFTNQLEVHEPLFDVYRSKNRITTKSWKSFFNRTSTPVGHQEQQHNNNRKQRERRQNADRESRQKADTVETERKRRYVGDDGRVCSYQCSGFVHGLYHGVDHKKVVPQTSTKPGPGKKQSTQKELKIRKKNRTQSLGQCCVVKMIPHIVGQSFRCNDKVRQKLWAAVIWLLLQQVSLGYLSHLHIDVDSEDAGLEIERTV